MTGLDGYSLLTISQILLVAAAIWAVVELALTIRKTRSSVKEVTENLNETINQVNPVVDKLDGMVDELDPAIKQADPLMSRLNTAVDALTCDLVRVDDVLADVSKVTNTGANVSTAVTSGVTKAVGNLGNAAADVAARLSGKPRDDAGQAKLAEHWTAASSESPERKEAEIAADKGYFTYGETDEPAAPKPEPAAEPATAADAAEPATAADAAEPAAAPAGAEAASTDDAAPADADA